MKTIFTTGQVAKICKVAPRTVSKWFDSGRIQGYRIPGSQDRRIPRAHLIEFLRKHGLPLDGLELEDERLSIFCFTAMENRAAVTGVFSSDSTIVLECGSDLCEAVSVISCMRADCVIVDYSLPAQDVYKMVRFLLGRGIARPALIGIGPMGIAHDGMDKFVSDMACLALDVPRAMKVANVARALLRDK